MYIRKIWLENVRCFGSGEQRVEIDLQRPDGSFAGWTVFAGRNGSGKSTLLKSVALAVSGPKTAGKLSDSFQSWVRHGSDTAYLAVDLERSSADNFTGGGAIAKGAGPFWAELEMRQAPDEPEPVIAPYDKAESPKNAERGPWAENPKGWFLAGYGPFRRLSGHSADSVRRMAGPARVAATVSLFREEASLAECVEWLRDVYLRQLEGNAEAKDVLEGVLMLLNDGLLPEGVRAERINSDGLWTSRGAIELPLRELSDGYRSVAALVVDIVKQLHACYRAFDFAIVASRPAVTSPGVVLVDEADIHLHPSWQQRLGFWLKEHFPNIQFLVTTHSPFICQAADPRGLVRLPAPGSAERVEHLPDEIFKTVVQGGADDAALTALFGLEHTHSEASEVIRRRVADLETRSFRKSTTPEEDRELDGLRAQLPQTGTVAIEQVLRNLGAAE